jgi:hypothetical protein
MESEMVKMRAVLPLLLLFAMPLRAADVSGEWSVKGSFDSTTVAKGMQPQADLVCTFAQQSATLTGSCRPPDGPGGVPIAGLVQGQQVEWHFDIAIELNGKKQTVTYISTLNDAGTSMRGTFAIADRRGEFTAEKQ